MSTATEAGHPAVSSTLPASGNPLRAGWEHWKKLAHAVGVVQTRFLLVVFYFLFVMPLGLVMRLTQDKLQLRRPTGSCWAPHAHEEQSIEAARRQF
jgi:hypothetical protein